MGTRTSRINALRGFCREFGLAIPQGSRTGVEAMARLLADPASAIPGLIRGTMKLLIEEIRLLEARIAQLEKELGELAKRSPACQELLTVPGIGLLTATAMVGRRHRRRGESLPGRPPLRQLVRAHAQGIQFRFHPTSGAHLQARRPLS